MDSNEVAVKQYNWKGQVVAYNQENTWIPAGVDGWISRELEERIHSGECKLVEPEITLVYDVYGEKEEWRGYLWNDMFVPDDENNSLFRLIKSRVLDKTCKVEKLPSIKLFDSKYVSEFIVGIHFDTQWLSIKNEINAQIKYSLDDPNASTYNVRYKNLYCHNSPSIEEIIKSDRGIVFHSYPFDEGEPRGSILEISLPIENLGYVLKTFRRKMHSANFQISLLDDQLEMHFAQTGRKPARGPTVGWLQVHLCEYLDDFILDIGNRALDYISYSGYSFEDQYLKHISMRTVHSKSYILRKYMDNTYEQHKMVFFRDYRYYSADERNTVLNQDDYKNIVNEVDASKTFVTRVREIPLKKVRTMIEAGLTLEALCILNGYLEVAYEIALRLAFPDDRMGCMISSPSFPHHEVLKLVKSINSLPDNLLKYGETYRKSAVQIYAHRNDYLHDLRLPEASVFMTNVKRLELETLMDPFIQAHESRQFSIYLDGYRNNAEVQKLIISRFFKDASE